MHFVFKTSACSTESGSLILPIPLIALDAQDPSSLGENFNVVFQWGSFRSPVLVTPLTWWCLVASQLDLVVSRGELHRDLSQNNMVDGSFGLVTWFDFQSSDWE